MSSFVTARDAITQLGLTALIPQGLRAVFAQAGVPSLRDLTQKAQACRDVPGRLQFRLRYLAVNESTDAFLQGTRDEVYMSAVATDSADVTLGPDGQPIVTVTTTPRIGDISSNDVRDPWRDNPHVLVEFNLRRQSSWPRSFVVTLLFVEHDNGDLSDTFTKVENEVGTEIKSAAVSAATAGATALAGAALGSIIPGIGTAVGAAVGALAGEAYDALIGEIADGLGDDVFPPQPILVSLADPGAIRQHPQIGPPQGLIIHGHGAKYGLEYDWHLLD